MPLQAVRVEDLSLVHLREAPVGAILQIAGDRGLPFSALRVSLPTVGGPTLGIVVLEGDEAGSFLYDEEAPSKVVLDISALVSIAVVDPAPSYRNQQLQPIGTLCWVGRSDGQFNGIGLASKGSSSPIAYAEVTGERRGYAKMGSPDALIGRIVLLPIDQKS